MKLENIKLPIIIIGGGIIIAIMIYIFNISNIRTDDSNLNTKSNPETGLTFMNIKPVSSTDHIIGNPEADIIFIEYSDTECPYCKSFHATMNKIISEYGKNGKVAWVYRHMPISALHTKSENEANATECVASLGGERAFWSFINELYDVTSSNDSLNPETIFVLAGHAGVNEKDFNKCLTEKTFKDKIESDYQDGLIANNNQESTPNSVVVFKTALTKDSIDKLQLEFAQYGVDLNISLNNKIAQFAGGLPSNLISLIIKTVLNQ